MLTPDRRRLVLEHVQRDGSALVETLADALDVSPSTIRRDLADLEREGKLRRARGGAYVHRTSAAAATASAPRTTSGNTQSVQDRIARAAAARVADGMTVMLVSGSTTHAMVRHLAGRDITVVTNGLDVGHALATQTDASVVVLGGVLHRDQMTLLGPMTEQNMANLHVDVMFAGAWGIHPDTGVTSAKIIQAGHHELMLRHTESLVVVADATKFGRRGPTVLARTDQVDLFVTDTDAPPDVVAALEAGGSQVELC